MYVGRTPIPVNENLDRFLGVQTLVWMAAPKLKFGLHNENCFAPKISFTGIGTHPTLLVQVVVAVC